VIGRSHIIWTCLAVGVVGCRTSPASERASSDGPARTSPSELGPMQPTAPSPVSQVPEVQSSAPAVLVFDETHDGIRASTVKEQQAYLIELVSHQLNLPAEQRDKVRAIVEKSEWLSFGNPKVSKPAMTKAACRQRRTEGEWQAGDAACGAPNMVAVNGMDGKPDVCIDQYEFPNVACEYPVVWVRASEAAALCEAVGKRLCDAHEWEGACAGAVLPVEKDYPWDHIPKSIAHSPRREQRLWLEYEHNRTRDVRWAYGDHVDHALCGTGAKKEPKCEVLDFSTCSTSSYPAGAFPQCVSSVGVYDQHGNAAEHMNLPLNASELTSAGGSGWTEMKGSWFIFSSQETHADDCRWRAKSWHTTRVTDWNSHRNYHLGFRCCRDVQ
jgi:formylglycine-generating enzyme